MPDGLNALSDPTRRRIVEMLAEKDLSAGEIVAAFEVSAPAISQHLKVLRESGLTKVRAEGKQRIHSLDPAGLDEIGAWLERTRSFWSSRLDALERELLKESKNRKKKSS